MSNESTFMGNPKKVSSQFQPKVQPKDHRCEVRPRDWELVPERVHAAWWRSWSTWQADDVFTAGIDWDVPWRCFLGWLASGNQTWLRNPKTQWLFKPEHLGGFSSKPCLMTTSAISAARSIRWLHQLLWRLAWTYLSPLNPMAHHHWSLSPFKKNMKWG